MTTFVIDPPSSILGGECKEYCFPTAEMPAGPAIWESDTALRTYDVLVIEDNELTAQYIASLLETAGYKALLAESGQEGSDLCDRFIPQVILMDIGLPDIDGISLSKNLRKDPRFTGIPMIAVTADTESDKLDSLFDAGMNGCIYKKDLNFETLIWEINRQISLSSQNKGGKA